MSTTKWAHLPNAVHIDRILASLSSHLSQWDRGLPDTGLWFVARNRARSVTIRVSRYAKWCALRDTVWAAVRNTEIRGVLLCLVAYDDCAHMLDSEVSELKMLVALGDQKAILMLPACIVLNAIKEIA